jgi:hypothetical protein
MLVSFACVVELWTYNGKINGTKQGSACVYFQKKIFYFGTNPTQYNLVQSEYFLETSSLLAGHGEDSFLCAHFVLELSGARGLEGINERQVFIFIVYVTELCMYRRLEASI